VIGRPDPLPARHAVIQPFPVFRRAPSYSLDDLLAGHILIQFRKSGEHGLFPGSVAFHIVQLLARRFTIRHQTDALKRQDGLILFG
jgi:hypothetical protein